MMSLITRDHMYHAPALGGSRTAPGGTQATPGGVRATPGGAQAIPRVPEASLGIPGALLGEPGQVEVAGVVEPAGAHFVHIEVDSVGANIEIEANSAAPPRKRARVPQKKWHRRQTECRQAGEVYTGKTMMDGVREPIEKCQREMKRTCVSEFCRGSTKRFCSTFSEERRREIFHYFWKELHTWRERRIYISCFIDDVEKQSSTSQRRTLTKNYFLEPNFGGGRRQVCATMFCSTLGMSLTTLDGWLYRRSSGLVQPVQRSGTHLLPEADIRNMTDFLNSLATVPSHYCRAEHGERKFLEPGTKLKDLYAAYRTVCGENNRRPVSRFSFEQEITKMNMSVFIPRKDLCSKCATYQQGNLSNGEHQVHVAEKDKAREEKSRDKRAASEKVDIWTADMQSVLLAPKSEASTMYYKKELCIHNQTFYNLRTKEGFCYVWTEVDGGLSASDFASIYMHHFREYIDGHRDITNLLIFSDGCGYQNRNCVLAGALLDLARQTGVTIEHKYLVPGHTQMECDSMHALIERQSKGPMYAPEDYLNAMRTARCGQPYVVRQLFFNFFKDFSHDGVVPSIRPARGCSG